MADNSQKTNLTATQVTERVTRHLAAAQKANIRLPVVIYADDAQAEHLCAELAKQFSPTRTAWVSEHNTATNNIFAKNATFVIGKEFEAAFFYYKQHSDVNLFAALAGTLLGGGLFITILDKLAQNPSHRFEARLLKIINYSNCIKIFSKENGFEIDESQFCTETLQNNSAPDYSEQLTAINLIQHVATGPVNQPLVIKAARGRGKSAALGIACAKLKSQAACKTIITAPTRAATTVLFKHFNVESNTAESLSFFAPDELVRTLPTANLLIIDEAASLPTPMLSKLLAHYRRIVFATTTQGYEGSGQSFTIRFQPYLDTLTPKWKEFTLTNPIRWANNDPLESLTNQLFLFDSPQQTNSINDQATTESQFSLLDRSSLLQDEPLLRQIYHLLQLAHYKTRPSDLKQILNNTDYTLFIARWKTQVTAVAIAISEGELDENLSKEIYRGSRRPIGNLLPQSLAFHLAQPDMAASRYLRVSRIAVHPSIQHQGVGSHLLSFIEKYAEDNKYDAIGSSFGATPQLLHFWLEKDYQLLRIGHSRKASSAMHAALVLKALNDDSHKSLAPLRAIFFENFELQLTEALQQLEIEIICTIYRFNITENEIPDSRHWKNAYSYVFLNRNYDDCQSSLIKCLRYALSDIDKNTIEDYTLLNLAIYKLLQRHSWQELAQTFNLSGKKQAALKVKSQFAQMLIRHMPNEIKNALYIIAR